MTPAAGSPSLADSIARASAEGVELVLKFSADGGEIAIRGSCPKAQCFWVLKIGGGSLHRLPVAIDMVCENVIARRTSNRRAAGDRGQRRALLSARAIARGEFP